MRSQKPRKVSPSFVRGGSLKKGRFFEKGDSLESSPIPSKNIFSFEFKKFFVSGVGYGEFALFV